MFRRLHNRDSYTKKLIQDRKNKAIFTKNGKIPFVKFSDSLSRKTILRWIQIFNTNSNVSSDATYQNFLRAGWRAFSQRRTAISMLNLSIVEIVNLRFPELSCCFA